MLRSIAAILLLCFSSLPICAQDIDYSWTFDDGGNFDVAVFWSPILFEPGGTTDRVTFELGVSPANRYTMTNVNGINQQLIVENDSLNLMIGD